MTTICLHCDHNDSEVCQVCYERSRAALEKYAASHCREPHCKQIAEHAAAVLEGLE